MANIRILACVLLLTLFSTMPTANARIGMIFTGPNPLKLYGLFGTLNTLDGSFKIGNSELASESAVLTVRTDADPSVWTVQVSGNDTRLAPNQIIEVIVTVKQQRELPRGTYNFTVSAQLKPEVKPEGSMGILEHTETVSIILGSQAELPSSMYSITVFTEPEVHVPFQIDSGGTYSTPKCVGSLSAGKHVVQLLPPANYTFMNWENGETGTNRELVIDGKDLSIIAHLKPAASVSGLEYFSLPVWAQLPVWTQLAVWALFVFACVYLVSYLVLGKKKDKHPKRNPQQPRRQ